jgi:hypothetical protein
MRYYYIANSDHSDQIYGNQEPICIDLAEVKRLAKEWDMTMDELISQMHVASAEEIEEHGAYDSEYAGPVYWYAVMQDDEDNDWGYGSFDLDKAKEMVKKFLDGHIAVIEVGDDPICVGEIRE